MDGSTPDGHGAAAPPLTARLSRLQKSLLRWLIRRHNYIAEHGNPYEQNRLHYFGVKWRPQADTPSQRASVSRAIREMENRGLLLRQNVLCEGRARLTREDPHDRTTHVKLLPAGDQAAKLLTN